MTLSLTPEYEQLCRIKALEESNAALRCGIQEAQSAKAAAYRERDALRETVTRLNRRCQKAEAKLRHYEMPL